MDALISEFNKKLKIKNCLDEIREETKNNRRVKNAKARRKCYYKKRKLEPREKFINYEYKKKITNTEPFDNHLYQKAYYQNNKSNEKGNTCANCLKHFSSKSNMKRHLKNPCNA